MCYSGRCYYTARSRIVLYRGIGGIGILDDDRRDSLGNEYSNVTRGEGKRIRILYGPRPNGFHHTYVVAARAGWKPETSYYCERYYRIAAIGPRSVCRTPLLITHNVPCTPYENKRKISAEEKNSFPTSGPWRWFFLRVSGDVIRFTRRYFNTI